MITGLKPYPRYKDSGVEWLGHVPEGWDVCTLGTLTTSKGERGRPDLPLLSVVRDKGVILRSTMADEENHNFIPDDLSNYKVVHEGNLVINKMKAWQGSLGIAPTDGVVSPAYYVFDFQIGDQSYGQALLRSKPYVALFARESDGVRIGQWDLSVHGMKRIPVVVPPLSEQAAIVRFLDHADRRIRQYIRAKQKLIALLNEQKQAIVRHFVFMGLDPNVSLRPSGLAWLGELPQHWDIRRNGQLFIQRNETGFAELPILEVSLRTGIRIRDFENSNRKQVMSDRSKYKRAAKGDIAYNMMRMWQGAVGVAPEDGLVSPAYVVARPLPRTEPRFYAYLFRTFEYMAEVDKYSRGIVRDRNRLYWEGFKQMPSPYPPYSEQLQIADAIDRRTSSLDSAIDLVNEEITLLREYRTRLIADVVTGKLDVRAAAAALPDEAAELEESEDSFSEADTADEEELDPAEAEEASDA